MNVDSVNNGVVIDHISAGNSMSIYEHLGLAKLGCTVALIQNVKSVQMGIKDIIKIDTPMEINLDVLGYLDPDATVNIIKDKVLVEKFKLELPCKIINVGKCKNPRCITTIENALDQIFMLTDKDRRIYRCIYCETEISKGIKD